jgi:hypothetical protein
MLHFKIENSGRAVTLNYAKESYGSKTLRFAYM